MGITRPRTLWLLTLAGMGAVALAAIGLALARPAERAAAGGPHPLDAAERTAAGGQRFSSTPPAARPRDAAQDLRDLEAEAR